MQEHADAARQQLGWYTRNCAQSTAAGRLEFVLLNQLMILKGGQTGEQNMPDLRKFTTRKEMMRELRQLLQRYDEPPALNESAEQNALFARDEFALDGIDTAILLLLIRYERNRYIEEFADEVVGRFGSVSRAIATLIGADSREVHRRIMPGSALFDGGILSTNDDGRDIAGRCGYLQIAPPLRKAMFPCLSGCVPRIPPVVPMQSIRLSPTAFRAILKW